MKKTKLSKYQIINGIFVLGAIIIWGILLCMHLSNYNYLYPTISDVRSFVLSTLLNLFLPIIPLGVSTVCIFRKKAKVATISLILFIPLLVFSYMRGSAEILFSPTVHSHTNNAAHFGVYDERFGEVLELNPVVYFPVDIPNNVENVSYCYYYRYASAEAAYLSISWQFEDEDDYSRIASEFKQLQASIGDNGYVFTDSYYTNAVFIDDDTLRIAYVITSTDEYLPKTIEEAASCCGTLVK